MIPEPKRGETRGQADYSDPDASGVALKAWRGNSDVQKWGCCATPPVSESGLFLLSTGSPFGHHPRLSIGCPRRGQRVNTRETQLNSIPAYPLCSCGYSRSLLRRSPLLSHSLWYVCFCGYPHCTSSSSTSTQSNASGGGAPCVTAGDTRAKRGGTRGQADYSDPDAGGVALKAWRGNSDVQEWGCCATLPASEVCAVVCPRVRPSGITRG